MTKIKEASTLQRCCHYIRINYLHDEHGQKHASQLIRVSFKGEWIRVKVSRRRINLFLILVLVLTVIWFGYIGHQLIDLTSFDPIEKAVCWTVLALPFGAVFWLPFFHWRENDPTPPWLSEFMMRTSYLSMGYLSFLLLAVVVRDVFWLVSRNPHLYGEKESGIVLAAAIMMMGLGYVFANITPRIKRVRIPLESLPSSFEGYRIVQLSDMHIGTIVKRPFVERVVGRVNSLSPDLIALTGDIFEGDVSSIGSEVEPLTGLKARDGCYFVTGNHEYYWGVAQWVAELERMKITALQNEHRVIERGNQKIVIAGVNDRWAKQQALEAKCDPAAALDGAPADALVRILLAHQPQVAFEAANLGYALQLSGHTHGGQFIPWVFIAKLVHKFAAGLHRWGGLLVYVSRGTGFWGPPVRLGAPSEITLIELLRADHFD